MSVVQTHIVYDGARDCVSIFQSCSNPDKARAIDRTNEFTHALLGWISRDGEMTREVTTKTQKITITAKVEDIEDADTVTVIEGAMEIKEEDDGLGTK